MEGQMHYDPTHFGHAKTSSGASKLVDDQVDNVHTALIGRPYVEVIASSTLPSVIWEPKQSMLLDAPTSSTTAATTALDLVHGSDSTRNPIKLSKHDALDLTLRRNSLTSTVTSTTSRLYDGNSLVIDDCDTPVHASGLQETNAPQHQSQLQRQQQQQQQQQQSQQQQSQQQVVYTFTQPYYGG